jgi:dihydrofolate synthase/folylpolyglutamate synthase
MSYIAAVDHLYALGHELAAPAPGAPRRKFDLDHMRTLAAALGDPQTTFPAVLIAGTNGKGSTSATLASILTAAGYRTGLYTSPHLVRVNERIQIDGHTVPDDDFARLYFHVDDTAQRLVTAGDLPHMPSFFEVVTAIGFLYFAQQKIDIAVLEVGLGGRLDATNIVDPLISVITDIALDHQDYLGDTIAAITREKAGILRPHGVLVTLPQHPEANQAIGEAAAALNLNAISAANFIPAQTPGVPNLNFQAWEPQESLSIPRNRYIVTLDGAPLEVDSPLPGHHQQRNLALAVATAATLRNLNRYKSNPAKSGEPQESNENSYNISNAAIEAGIRNTRWPGRLELLTTTQPHILLDVAHNPAGAWALRSALSALPESRPRTLIFSCLRDKNLTEMAQILLPLFDSTSGNPDRVRDHIIFAPIDSPRAASDNELLAAAHALDIPAHAAPHLAAALAQARQVTPPEGLIVATGSVYLVGDLRRLAEAPE